MSYVNGTTHYNLPQTIGSDKRDWSDTNKAFADIDEAIYGAANGVNVLTPQVNNIQTELSDTKEDVTQNIADVASLGGRVTSAEQNINNLNNTVIDVRNDSEDMITAYKENSATASRNYKIGDYFIYNNTLYIATRNISSGTTIVPNTNCNTVTVTSVLTAIPTPKTVSLGSVKGMTYTQAGNAIYNTVHSLIGETSLEKLDSCAIAFEDELGDIDLYKLYKWSENGNRYEFLHVSANGTECDIRNIHLGANTLAYSANIVGSNTSITNIGSTTVPYSSAYLIYF